MYVWSCASVCVCVRGVCAVTKSVHSSSTAAAVQRHAVLQALASVPMPRCSLRVLGAQQKIELRQHFHVQFNSSQTHIVGSHIRYTKHATVAKVAAHTCTQHLNAYSMFPLLDLRRPGDMKDIKLTQLRRGTLHPVTL